MIEIFEFLWLIHWCNISHPGSNNKLTTWAVQKPMHTSLAQIHDTLVANSNQPNYHKKTTFGGEV